MSEYASCVGCGFCCSKAPCAGAVIYARIEAKPGPCTFLRFKDGRHWCGLVRSEEEVRNEPEMTRFIAALIRKELAIGEGCSSSMNSWRTAVIVDRRK